ncbi:PIR protein [Plasmodium yoelii]|uniref:PIR protein n=2 Tax=Plasmodium yoelii TaxID=5861 RepID=A0AAE9WXQ2_PLAYO|nr:PIR protein [Plasmodium yoelii]WBY58343.1 PIR protein [Plasmodium yoelii yoelii]VTZ79259.1 PIR protein [Plasmodium yoelii]|eukprot:XP_022810724.1 PIR protein [Plasmodium yoelii]
MDKTLCEQFDTLRNYLPDDLSKAATSDINNLENIKYYCSNEESEEKECETEFDKIKAGCLWLFEQLFVKNGKNINIVQYIIIWLSYKLNQKTYNGINNLNDFYNKCIKDNRHYTNCKQGNQNCSTSLNSNTGYNNYKEIINGRKNLLSTNIKNMSKIYDAFKPLCNMYTEIVGSNIISDKSIQNAKKFVEKYNELNKDSGNTEDDAYCQVLSTLLNDYNNLKEYCDSNNIDCSNITFLTSTKTEGNGVQSSEESSGPSSEVTSSSSSITSKLIPVLLILGAIPIFLGIAYKYSLFGFRKRVQKHLREKIKK